MSAVVLGPPRLGAAHVGGARQNAGLRRWLLFGWRAWPRFRFRRAPLMRLAGRVEPARSRVLAQAASPFSALCSAVRSRSGTRSTAEMSLAPCPRCWRPDAAAALIFSSRPGQARPAPRQPGLSLCFIALRAAGRGRARLRSKSLFRLRTRARRVCFQRPPLAYAVPALLAAISSRMSRERETRLVHDGASCRWRSVHVRLPAGRATFLPRRDDLLWRGRADRDLGLFGGAAGTPALLLISTAWSAGCRGARILPPLFGAGRATLKVFLRRHVGSGVAWMRALSFIRPRAGAESGSGFSTRTRLRRPRLPEERRPANPAGRPRSEMSDAKTIADMCRSGGSDEGTSRPSSPGAGKKGDKP